MLRGPDVRLRLITVLLIATLLLIVGQLVRLQVLGHAQHHTETEALVHRQYALPEPPWGIILDRNGNLLVGNLPVYNVGAEVNLVTDTVMSAMTLAPLLNRPAKDLQEVLTPPITDAGTSVWRPLANEVSEETAAKIRELGWFWITLTPTWQRFYAEGALASHTLGFVNKEGLGYGLQAFQLRFLRGNNLSQTGPVSVQSSPLADEVVAKDILPYPGTDLRLTLDRTIQAYIEGELDIALQEYGASGGTILVLNPRTGEILAIASRPNYEPYRYPDHAAAGEEALFLDPAASVPYEPGSVFKVLTLAAALDSGRATTDWSYYDNGKLEYGGIKVYNASRGAYGQQNLFGIISESLNVGASVLSTQVMGAEVFYQYLRAFGFGQTTGIEVVGESSGLVHLPSDWNWSDSYLATNAFGQGIAVTPLQLAAAVSAIANDGVMMQPHIIAERRHSDGRSVAVLPKPISQPISAETAHAVAEIMAQSVDKKSDSLEIPGYRLAGKSGTAQIPTTGGYEPDSVIASFIGFAPWPDPQVLILVKIDRPDGIPLAQRWGEYTAVPVFRRVMERVVVLMGVPPNETLTRQ
ncbi:MAG TPA: penicillin-binding protein 2 [Anaerolineae bacterium]|nr:penicillin-binding protein 2 [Anaerolineae bacterium]